MKKILPLTFLGALLLNANSELTLNSGLKDYKNSKTKVDGYFYNLNLFHKYKNSNILIGYSKDNIDRENPITKASIETLRVEKYNLNYRYILDEKISIKGSYIKILDNLAPTDQGKIYGLGVNYNLPKGFGTAFDIYRSNYEQFDVNQYDLTFFKKFKIGEIKAKAQISAKSINIDGNNYGTYQFTDKDYFTTAINLGMGYNGYTAGIGAFFGKRIFTVLDDGNKVQHHAIEQDKTYMLSVGKKFKNFDLALKYSFQNGDELPEQRDDVDQKVTSLMLKYKF